jgi:hypothetical protein
MVRRDDRYERGNKGIIVLVLLYIVLGIYFVNFPFSFIKIPEYISKFNNWIIFVGGVLLFLSVFRPRR